MGGNGLKEGREREEERERAGELFSNLDFESSRDFCVFVWTV
jgi:hypothetical protein